MVAHAEFLKRNDPSSEAVPRVQKLSLAAQELLDNAGLGPGYDPERRQVASLLGQGDPL
jgi:hypothetical protein